MAHALPPYQHHEPGHVWQMSSPDLENFLSGPSLEGGVNDLILPKPFSGDLTDSFHEQYLPIVANEVEPTIYNVGSWEDWVAVLKVISESSDGSFVIVVDTRFNMFEDIPNDAGQDSLLVNIVGKSLRVIPAYSSPEDPVPITISDNYTTRNEVPHFKFVVGPGSYLSLELGSVERGENPQSLEGNASEPGQRTMFEVLTEPAVDGIPVPRVNISGTTIKNNTQGTGGESDTPNFLHVNGDGSGIIVTFNGFEYNGPLRDLVHAQEVGGLHIINANVERTTNKASGHIASVVEFDDSAGYPGIRITNSQFAGFGKGVAAWNGGILGSILVEECNITAQGSIDTLEDPGSYFFVTNGLDTEVVINGSNVSGYNHLASGGWAQRPYWIFDGATLVVDQHRDFYNPGVVPEPYIGAGLGALSFRGDPSAVFVRSTQLPEDFGDFDRAARPDDSVVWAEIADDPKDPHASSIRSGGKTMQFLPLIRQVGKKAKISGKQSYGGLKPPRPEHTKHSTAAMSNKHARRAS